MVHNGVIWNDHELHIDHQKKGINYISEQSDYRFNDSEALLFDLASYLSGQQDRLKAEGDIAFIAVELDKERKPIKLHFGRNTNPLKMVLTRSKLVLASEGDGELIDTNTLYTFDYATSKLTTEPMTISTGYIEQTLATTSRGIGFRADDLFGYGYESYAGEYQTNQRLGSWQKIQSDDEIATEYAQERMVARLYVNDLTDEYGSEDYAYDHLIDEKDSIMGKLKRIASAINLTTMYSEAWVRLDDERDELWKQLDIVNACMNLLDEQTMIDSYTVRQGVQKLLKDGDKGRIYEQ